MPTVEEQLRRYADDVAGPPRHPHTAERADDGLVREVPVKGRLVLAAALVLFVVAVGYLVFAPKERSAPPIATDPTTTITQSTLDPQVNLLSPSARAGGLQDLYGPGWVPYENASAFDPTPHSGYMRAFPDTEGGPTGGGTPRRTPVYDAPDGNVIGYSYEAIGFIDKATADDPTFDPVRMVKTAFGCDPFTYTPGVDDDAHRACMMSILQQVGAQRN